MRCLECKKELSYIDHKESMDALNVELCKKHLDRVQKLRNERNTSPETIQLYYGLKAAGVSAMLEWWDGQKTVDIAISRVKLNILVDSEYQRMTHEQAINDLEETMRSFKNGFTTIRIPNFLIKQYPNETVRNIIGIMEGLKENLKTI